MQEHARRREKDENVEEIAVSITGMAKMLSVSETYIRNMLYQGLIPKDKIFRNGKTKQIRISKAYIYSLVGEELPA